MKSLLLVYNPVSGNISFSDYLDNFITKFQQDYQIFIHRTLSRPAGELARKFKFIARISDEFAKVVVAGGDGSLHRVVNIMMQGGYDIPLAVIPAGTVNDFASYLGMPADFEKCFDIILQNEYRPIDVGLVNDRFFINVCVGGLFSSTPHSTDSVFKSTLGKMAYYLQGLREITSFKTINIKITTDEEVFTEEIYLFLILNSRRGGGFKNISGRSSLDDGLFELIIVKAGKVYEIFKLVSEFLQENHLDNENIIYKQSSSFYIEALDLNEEMNITNLDGERGPSYPLKIQVMPRALKMIGNY